MVKVLKVVKKPLEAKAMQWNENEEDLLDFCGSQAMFDKWFHFEGEKFFVDTLEGAIHTTPGSYIIFGNHGEYWSIKEDIFHSTYSIIPEQLRDNNFQDRGFEPR
ncbi:hypothetical protein [Listeria newyorkensis]|uniref:hypothetical protein n=1 Tax=Listeria newyorkensis TaxID=1497681 RepID=UPI00051D7374|nr:hypothetical protein [Listeria newyorkensis]KGL43587.1 hypothetical protein EP58_07555 [Listeria newyorkensis]SQC56813.1 Uncharacterised protein [Listeria newyorkensis]